MTVRIPFSLSGKMKEIQKASKGETHSVATKRQHSLDSRTLSAAVAFVSTTQGEEPGTDSSFSESTSRTLQHSPPVPSCSIDIDDSTRSKAVSVQALLDAVEGQGTEASSPSKETSVTTGSSSQCPMENSEIVMYISQSNTVHDRTRLEANTKQRKERLGVASIDQTVHTSSGLRALEASSCVKLEENDGDNLGDPFCAACLVAKCHYEQTFCDSNIPDNSNKFPQFDLSEIQLGLYLGKGSTAQVLEVKGFALKAAVHRTSWAGVVNGYTSSMRQKRCAMADVDYDQDSDEEVKVSRELGYGDITDDELEVDDIGEDEAEHHAEVLPARKTRPKRCSSGESSLFSPTATTAAHRSLTHDETLNCGSFMTATSRHIIARNCHRVENNKGEEESKRVARYALKQLKRQIIEEPTTLMQGVADMAIETRILSSLTDHPNVLKLRGLARGSEMPFRNDYFILLDRLYDTLERRIKKWKTMEHQWNGPLGCIFRDPQRSKRMQLWSDRVSHAYDFSSAVSYIHSKHVIHRDLKPDNIGFDLRDDIKIFDFGLAKELPTVNNGPDDLFHFTGFCGSPRYMAPEVGIKKAYNEGCDVYSFGILIWEMLALKKAYGDVAMEDLISDVWKQDATARRPSPSLVRKGRFFTDRWRRGWKRPFQNKKQKPTCKGPSSGVGSCPPPDGSPTSIQLLLESCWSYRLSDRPSMRQVEDRLKSDVLALQDRSDGECGD